MGIAEQIKEMVTKPIESDLVIKKGVDSVGPPSFMIVEWNRQTQKIFRKGNLPRRGKRYVLRCEGFDGKRAYFILDEM
jgi:hypothetical protein